MTTKTKTKGLATEIPVLIQVIKQTPVNSAIMHNPGLEGGLCNGVKYSTQMELLGRCVRILYEKPDGEKGFYDVGVNALAQAIIIEDTKSIQ